MMQNLRKRRILYGYSSAKLADKLGVSKASISKYESGKMSPTVSVLLQMSELLDCSTDYLLDITNCPDSDSEWIQNIHSMLKEIGFVNDGNDLSEKQYDFLISHIKVNLCANKDLLGEKLERLDLI